MNDHMSRHPLRTVRAIAHAPRQRRAPGFDVAFLHPEMIGGGMDPFLQIDAFALAEPVFKPHPHAGFNAVTYIFPESPIGFVNRDSLGNRQRIAPGALHWTTAGRGVMHEEIPEIRGTAALGLQIFVNLPRNLKNIDPGFLHLAPDEVPQLRAHGSTVRTVLGASNGLRSPLDPPTHGVRLIDVALEPGAVFEQELDTDENAFVWVFAGTATAQSADGERALNEFDFAGFERDGTRARLRAGPRGARLVLAAGAPINEPVVAGGPFVMSTPEDLDRAVADYQAGRMGRLSTSRYGDDARPLP